MCHDSNANPTNGLLRFIKSATNLSHSDINSPNRLCIGFVWLCYVLPTARPGRRRKPGQPTLRDVLIRAARNARLWALKSLPFFHARSLLLPCTRAPETATWVASTLAIGMHRAQSQNQICTTWHGGAYASGAACKRSAIAKV